MNSDSSFDFSDVSTLVWDFDGTIYQNTDELHHDIREAELAVIMKHTKWDHDRAEEEFYRIYKSVTPSGTNATSSLAGISIAQAAIETEQIFDRRKFLDRDDRLINLFQTLSLFTHIMMSNGLEDQIRRAGAHLGLDPDMFEAYITPEKTGVTKPDKKAFQAVLDHTRADPGTHLMIGDRDAVDLVVAHEMGMRTCLVWSEEQSSIADVTLKSVYEVCDVLKQV